METGVGREGWETGALCAACFRETGFIDGEVLGLGGLERTGSRRSLRAAHGKYKVNPSPRRAGAQD
jgi:hypothetical protein